MIYLNGLFYLVHFFLRGVICLKFYEISPDYLKYLKQFDNKVPDYSYTNVKFYCGVVLTLGDFEYFVPVSSFKKTQSTNMVIYDNAQKALSSLRFCFMIPIPKDKKDKIIAIKDFSKESDSAYIALLRKELRYCKNNKERIKTKATQVYNMGITPEHERYKECCKFKTLELNSLNYIP